MIRWIFAVVFVLGWTCIGEETEPVAAPKKANAIKYIDVHVHAHPVRDNGLQIVADWMEKRGIERCIVSPLNHKGSRAMNEKERAAMLANFAKYKGKIDRMCLIEPEADLSVEEAVKILD